VRWRTVSVTATTPERTVTTVAPSQRSLTRQRVPRTVATAVFPLVAKSPFASPQT
jgi:hypothetical protein